jgi:SAM-dependent methyltransferase
MDGNFSGHYEPWIHRRIEVITSHFGREWFAGKHVLELGCGYAAIGNAISQLGARVTCSDARQEHLDAIRIANPHLTLVLHDLDDGQWPYGNDYDLILHTGVLYHLKNYRPSIEHCLRSCRHLFLETEVLDSDADEVLLVEENREGYDQAFNGTGCRPSQLHLENILTANKCAFQRCFAKELNAEFHTYDWAIDKTRQWRHGLRRAWFVEGLSGASLRNRLKRLATSYLSDSSPNRRVAKCNARAQVGATAVRIAFSQQ